MTNAIPQTQPWGPQPFAKWNPTRGVWEMSQPDLFARLVPYSAIWPTSGSMRNGLVYRRPSSVLHTTGTASSSSPTGTLFRTPLASDSSRGSETLDRVKARRGTIALSHQIIDFALHGPDGSPTRPTESETLWSLIEQLFDSGENTPTPSRGGSTPPDDKPPHLRFWMSPRNHDRHPSSWNG